jgi:chemotaxis response regulator CheB
VFGMPKAAIERGYALRVVSLDSMANTLQAQCLAGRTVTRSESATEVRATT